MVSAEEFIGGFGQEVRRWCGTARDGGIAFSVGQQHELCGGMVMGGENIAEALTNLEAEGGEDNYHGSIDDPIEDGDPVLHLCCLYGHLPCVKLVVERGANLESKDAEGAIPLHDACAGGFTEIVQFIFDAAGSPESIKRMLDAVDVEGDTPLHNASRGEHVDVVNLLLSLGASPKKTNNSGKIPAELADPDAPVLSFLESAAASDSMSCQ